MRHAGPFFEEPNSITVQSGYFSGMQIGSTLHRILEEIKRVHQADPNKKFFFGPRIEFGYQLLGTPSSKKLPLWWHPGTSYAYKDLDSVVLAFKNSSFDFLVFSKNDRTRFPEAIVMYMSEHYEKIDGYDALDVFKKIERSDIANSKSCCDNFNL